MNNYLSSDKLDELWKFVERVGKVDRITDDGMIVLGSVFGQMRAEIERLQEPDIIGKQKLLEFMTKRFRALEDQVFRDFGGGSTNKIGQYREIKYWKEAIERGEFDSISEGLSEFDKNKEVLIDETIARAISKEGVSK